ncbi:MAG: retroviral-like aspartic protease family protein [Dehalococcoidia bacterium]|nr:retroviral-like aspartic protease family protein [Dehalococcoidia bacterium]
MVSIWLSAFVYLPKFNKAKQVDFIIDTGAEGSTLDMPVAKLMVPRKSLFEGHRMSKPRPVVGIGGSARYYPEEALILLEHDGGKLDVLPQIIDIPVATKKTWDMVLGSILGMDILSRYRVTIDFSQQIAVLEYPTGNQPGPPVGPESLTPQMPSGVHP